MKTPPKKTTTPPKPKKTTTPPKKSLRGFASMTKERQREVAAMGGRALKPEDRSFSRDRALASAAGKVGGLSVRDENRSYSRDRQLASASGRKGGRASKRRSVHAAE